MTGDLEVGRSQRIAYRPRTRTSRIIIHDSHTGPEVTNVVDYLRSNGRYIGLLDIGYNYVIERSGMVTETRPGWAIGSHTPGHNHDSVGVCLAASDNSPPTEAQLAALASLITTTREHFNYVDMPVVGHYEIPRSGGYLKERKCRCPCLDMDKLRKELPDASRYQQ